MDNQSGNNLFLASVVALIFVFVVGAAVWVAQVSPLTMGTVTTEAAPAAAPVEPAPAPAQTSKGDPVAGAAKFAGTCSACHGPGGEGIQGLGKNLTASQFVAGLNDDDMVAFIKVGRPTSDPLNTTKIDMPPKGGNPSLNDDDLYNIVAHIRAIQK